MGFDPSTIKRPVPVAGALPPNASREQRILTLAQELHLRGVTVSLADAKRLAEGMVDVERKVIDEGSRKRDEPRPQDATRASIQSSDPMFVAAGVSQAPPQRASSGPVPTLSLVPDFARFVERVAGTPGAHTAAAPVPAPTASSVAVSRAPELIPAAMPSPRAAPAMYGRNDEFKTAAVPHASARKQMFFDDAPPLSQLRGFQQTGVPDALKFRGFQGTESSLRSAPVSVVTAPAVAVTSHETFAVRPPAPAESVVREEVTPSAFVREEMAFPEPSPTYVAEPAVSHAAAEEGVVSEQYGAFTQDVMSAPEPMPTPTPFPEPEPMPFPDPAPEPLPEPTPEPDPVPAPEPVATAPEKPVEDLAKQHGVDIFQMFKKK